RELIPRAKGFGLKVIGWSRSLTPESAERMGIHFRSTIREVSAESDILSVHLALTPETRHIINADVFGAMRDGAYFINTSRAEVVDQFALGAAVRHKN